MTLEQITQQAQEAAAAGDLESLQAALAARSIAISKLIHAAPSPDLFTQLAAAIEAGKSLDRDLSALKLRLSFESARLSQLQTGFIAGLGSAPAPSINVRA